MGDRDNGATVRLAATIARSRHEADGGTMLDGIHPDTIVEMALAAKREVDGLRTELAEARAALGTAKHQRDEWMRFCDKAERERDEAQREVDRLHPCADSQNEDACGECVACLRVGMDAAIASRNEFRAALAHAEATIAKLREAMPGVRVRSAILTMRGMTLPKHVLLPSERDAVDIVEQWVDTLDVTRLDAARGGAK